MILFFVVSIAVISIGLNSIFGRQESKLRYKIEDGIKYLEIENGFIKEKLIIESGETLPNIRDYFDDNYDVLDTATISYFKDKEGISLGDFTYEIDNDIFVRGTGEISVIINNGKEYETKLIINDTIVPDVALDDVTISEGEKVDAKDFVAIYDDNSQLEQYSAEFVNAKNYSKAGIYDVKINICDGSNNCIEHTATLTVKKIEEDKTKPDGGTISKPNNSGSSSKPSGGGSSSKPSGSGGTTTKPPSSGSSGGSSGSGSSSGGSSGGTTPSRVYVKTITEKNAVYKLKKTEFNTTYRYYAENVTFDVYSDGYKKVKAYSGNTWLTYDPKEYKGNMAALKKEANSYIALDPTQIENTRYIFLKNSNEVRAKYGRKALVLDDELCKVAQVRAIEIAFSQKVINESTHKHIRPDNRSFSTIFDDYGYKFSSGTHTMGENFAAGQPSDKRAIDDLIASKGHRDNIINENFTKMGVARFNFLGRSYWIQLFVS